MRKPTKKEIKEVAQKAGFLVLGDFLIARRTSDVISGLVIDAAPSSTYIWTFILPTFDANEFLHMSLGERVAVCNAGVACLGEGYRHYNLALSHVESTEQLIHYLDKNHINNEYAAWTRYITLIRTKKILEAQHYRVMLAEHIKSASISARLRNIDVVLEAKGWGAAYQLLDEWSKFTDKLLPAQRWALQNNPDLAG